MFRSPRYGSGPLLGEVRGEIDIHTSTLSRVNDENSSHDIHNSYFDRSCMYKYPQ